MEIVLIKDQPNHPKSNFQLSREDSQQNYSPALTPFEREEELGTILPFSTSESVVTVTIESSRDFLRLEL